MIKTKSSDGNVLSGMQFRRIGASAVYNSVNVPSLEEAEKLLNEESFKWIREHGIFKPDEMGAGKYEDACTTTV
jgi:hypothetical protein